MNDCPPQPGLTVMQRTMSARPPSSETASTGVPGLIATPARQPSSRIAARVRLACGVASSWKVIESAPGLGEGLDLALGLGDHQVDVDRAAGRVDLVGDRGEDQRPDRDRRHEVPVHDVEVDHPGAGVHHLVDLLAEPGEVGREDRRRDARLADQLRHPSLSPRLIRASASNRRSAGSSCPRCCSSGRSSGVRRSSGTARPARSGADSTRSAGGRAAGSGAATARRSPGRAPA